MPSFWWAPPAAASPLADCPGAEALPPAPGLPRSCRPAPLVVGAAVPARCLGVREARDPVGQPAVPGPAVPRSLARRVLRSLAGRARRVSPSRSPAVPARPAGPGGFPHPVLPVRQQPSQPAPGLAFLRRVPPAGRPSPAPGHRPGRRTAAATVPAGLAGLGRGLRGRYCAGAVPIAAAAAAAAAPAAAASAASFFRAWRSSRSAVLGIQPGAFGRDQVIGLAQPGQHFPDAVRIRCAARPDLPPDPVPGSAHERHPPALGQLTVAGCGHPGEVFQDEPVGGEVRRNLHAQIIPLKRQNVEPMPSSRQRRAGRDDARAPGKRRRDGPVKGAAPYGLLVGRCAPTSYRTRSPCRRRRALPAGAASSPASRR